MSQSQKTNCNLEGGWNSAAVQARTVAEGIIATVQLMSKSGLPCYGRGAPLSNLRKRFHLEMNDTQAAAFMRHAIKDAYDKVLAVEPTKSSKSI